MYHQLVKAIGYLLLLFIGGIAINVLFKDDANIITAFPIALGSSIGLVYVGPYLFQKFSKS